MAHFSHKKDLGISNYVVGGVGEDQCLVLNIELSYDERTLTSLPWKPM